MGTFVRGLATLVAAVVVGSSAHAADLPSPPPAPSSPLVYNPTPVANWAGLYTGSVYGVGFANVRSSQIATKSVSLSGQTGGALIGYDWESNQFVYGVEGDITLHVLRGVNSGTAGLTATRVDLMYSAHARVRLGYDLGNFLPFVAAGVATNELYESTPLPTDWFGQDRRQTGWTIGGGLDFKMTVPVMGPIVLRAEYLYEGYPQSTFAFAGLPGGPINSRLSSQFIRVALISRIGDTAPPAPPADPSQFDWSGSYGGIIGGGSWLRARTTAPGAAPSSLSASGPMGGIFTGRNFMFGRYVLGWDGSTELSDFTGNGAEPTSANADFRGNIETDLRLRAGYSFGRLLPYVSGGFLWERSEQKDTMSGSELGRLAADSWTLGTGIDYAVTDRVFLRGEYLFAKTYSVSDPTLNGCACTQNQNSSLLRFGVAYLFH